MRKVCLAMSVPQDILHSYSPIVFDHTLTHDDLSIAFVSTTLSAWTVSPNTLSNPSAFKLSIFRSMEAVIPRRRCDAFAHTFWRVAMRPARMEAP